MYRVSFPSTLGFREGHLYLFASDGSVRRLSVWPWLNAERRQKDGSWAPIDECERDDAFGAIYYLDRLDNESLFYFEGRLLILEEVEQLCFEWAPNPEERRSIAIRRAMARFLATLPHHVREVLPKVLALKWISFLEWAREMPRQFDLLKHDPNLALALARHWEFPAVGAKNWSEARAVAQKRRRQILGWLGFCPTEANANALRRLDLTWPMRNSPVVSICTFLNALKDPIYRTLLASRSQVSAIHLEVLTDPSIRPIMTPHVIRLLAQMNDDDQISALYHLEDAAQIARAGIVSHDMLISQLDSRLLKRGIQLSRRDSIDRPLQLGPAPTSTCVTPITTVHALIEEGDRMKLCIGSTPFILRGVRGQCAYYHLDAPRPATLALQRGKASWEWSLEQVAREENELPSLEDVRTIQEAFPQRGNRARVLSLVRLSFCA